MTELLQIIRQASEKFPGIRYVWGAVAIAAAGGLYVKILGQDRAAIIIWALSFLAFVLVTALAGGSTSRATTTNAPRLIIIYATVTFFCIFMLLTVSVFMGYGPSNWADFLGIGGAKAQDFERHGGSVNFGCERGSTATVSYTAPPGYRILSVNAFPFESSNAKAQTPYVISNDGHTVNAKVDYFGKDREFFNCPGGGHGAAQLKGVVVPEDAPSLVVPGLSLALASFISIIALASHRRRSAQ